MAKKKVDAEHVCDRSDIEWRAKPSLKEGSDGNILWFGKCGVCRRVVYEVYAQQEELYDVNTDEPVDEFGK